MAINKKHEIIYHNGHLIAVSCKNFCKILIDKDMKKKDLIVKADTGTPLLPR